MFEADGYEGASISRIVTEADVSRGTFYLYFETKQDVFSELVRGLQAAILEFQDDVPSAGPAEPGRHPQRAIEASIRAFLGFYRDNARLLSVLEQVATYHPVFRPMRLEMRRAVAKGAARFIAAMQRSGEVDRLLDPRIAATALTGMVDRFAFVWFILGEDFEEDEVVANLARLWLQSIGGTADPRAEGC